MAAAGLVRARVLSQPRYSMELPSPRFRCPRVARVGPNTS